ncbi:MAG: hypothetical protein ABSB82_22635 [Terriglobia bacterium]|jgi:hypothetical protein
MPKCFRTLIPALFLAATASAAQPIGTLQYHSEFIRVELAPGQPAFLALTVDSLGKNKLSANPLRPPAKAETAYQVRHVGTTFEYRLARASAAAPPAWTFQFSPRRIHLRSQSTAGKPPPPLVLNFNPHLNHATLLGLINDDSTVRLPALLHLPDLGTLRITSSSGPGLALGYDAFRYDDAKQGDDYVRVSFPAATAALPQIDYDLEVVDIYPASPKISGDPRFDGFRRDWLNIFQLNPRRRVLANHAASDPVAFTVFLYSSMAVHTPPLAPGLTALDMVRQTLDRYLGGMKGYGMKGYGEGYDTRYDFTDTYPSLLIAASDYVQGSKDHAWLEKNYAGLKDWATKMLAMDVGGDGLLEYPVSGNYNSWPEKIVVRPANWWDTIGFGHQDAYSNAIAYHALANMAGLARQANQPDDAQMYSARAEKLRSVYFHTFYDPEAGVLAGWKSADGNLHDYYFTFVNSVAITYGLVPRDMANLIMDRMLAEMKKVGYTHFEYGLPGNLIPVRRGDYVDLDPRFGGPKKEDGSDGFQIYENGGATACWAYYTLEALYKLDRRKDADAMLFPMLAGFEKGGFQGFGPNGMTYDWKAWDGTPHGYEGLLVDGYQSLLAVLSR